MRHPHGLLTLRREDGRIVCERVLIADTWVRRLRGGLFHRTLASDQGFVLRPSFSIHTWFMHFPIDVVFLDQDLQVVKISPGVPPFHTASCRGAREVVELRAGECERRGLVVGDRVAWASHRPAMPTAPGLPPEPFSRDEVGSVVIASRDAYFLKLARFLLEGHQIECRTGVDPDALDRALAVGDAPAAAILDVDAGIAEGLAIANAARALHPDVSIFLTADTELAGRAPAGVEIYDKWAETERLIEAVVAASGGGTDT